MITIVVNTSTFQAGGIFFGASFHWLAWNTGYRSGIEFSLVRRVCSDLPGKNVIRVSFEDENRRSIRFDIQAASHEFSHSKRLLDLDLFGKRRCCTATRQLKRKDYRIKWTVFARSSSRLLLTEFLLRPSLVFLFGRIAMHRARGRNKKYAIPFPKFPNIARNSI